MTQHIHSFIAFRVLLLACFILGIQSVAHAACTPPGSPGDDLIICTGTDTSGVASNGGKDTVNITAGAQIMLDAFGINQKTTAVDAGDDRDSVFNAGAVVAEALALLTPVLTPPAPAPGSNLIWGALIKVGPEAKGIDGGAGNDTITNTGSVSSTVSAMTLSSTVPAAVEGIAKADISSTANAKSTAIDGGDDEDSITNVGSFNVDATASATGVSVSLAPIKEDGKDGKSKLNGNVKASASATGLAGGAGNDTVTNIAAFDVTSSSFALAAAGTGVEAKGSAAASAASTAGSDATAIDLGGGHDTLDNHEKITATAGSTATALDVAVGDKTDPNAEGKVKAAADGSATAKSTATGISADGGGTKLELDPELLTDDTSATLSISLKPQALASGNDTVTNTAEIEATANATTVAASVGVTINGDASAKVTSNSEGDSTAIDLGGGDDTLTNTGKLTATADSIAVALDITVGTADPDANDKVKSASSGGANAQSHAIGIAADSVGTDTEYEVRLVSDDTSNTVSYSQAKAHASGDDTITNTAGIGVTANAITLAAGVGVAINGKASADVKSTAETAAAAIDLGGGGDTLTNTGNLTSTSIADASALNVAVGTSGESSRKNGSKSESAADGGATAKSTAVGISADGVAGDSRRGGSLVIDDQGPLLGYGLELSYDQSETHGRGDDVVSNNGAIEAHASATARAAGIGVTVKGAASANSTSTTESVVSAIDLGRGNDVLTNTGKLTATADSSSQALKAAVSTEGSAQSSDGLWDGGVKSEANATGIDAAGAADSSTVAELIIDDSGIHARYETRKGDVLVGGDVAQGDTADGNDRITNSGDIETHASATSNALNVAVTSDGTASAVSHVEAKAGSSGIRAGSGDDEIRNLGKGLMTVIAESHANTGKVAVSGKGTAVAADALWDGGTRSEANAVGIDGDGGVTDTKLVTVGIDSDGVEIVHETGTTSASGADTIVNEQTIEVTSLATAPSLSVALEAKKGLAATVSMVGSKAESTAIRGGDADDSITNHGKLASTSTATATAASLSVAKEGAAAAMDAGTTAEASAVGIDADGGNVKETARTSLIGHGDRIEITHENSTEGARGDDIVVNEGDIEAAATAQVFSLGVSITTKGLAAALSQSTATADSTAIHGGDGDDDITNRGSLTTTADATAKAASVSVTTDKGAALAGNAIWDGGTTAKSTAIGIDSDGGDRSSVTIRGVKIDGDGVHLDNLNPFAPDTVTESASGQDIINNWGQIDAIAKSDSLSVAASFAGNGLAGSIATSTADSRSTAIDSGDERDVVSNNGKLSVLADAAATTVNVAGTTGGISVAADSFWDGGTKAGATAKGIDTGAGNDNLTNVGDIDLEAESDSTNVSVSMTATKKTKGVAAGAALVLAATTAESTAVGLDGAVGDDVINNTGTIALTTHALEEIASTVSASASEGTFSFVDLSARGTDPSEFENKLIRIVTGANPIGFVTSVKEFNSVTGLITLNDAIPDGGLKAGDVYKINSTHDLPATAGVDANATTVGVSVAAAYTEKGVSLDAALSDSSAKATSTAVGIRGGSGNDSIDNDGEVHLNGVIADATAVGVSASVSVANQGVAFGAALANTSTMANAVAGGIAGDEGNDEIINRKNITIENIDSFSDSVTVAVSVAGTAKGLAAGAALSDASATAGTDAYGIDGGAGDDKINNDGLIRLQDINAEATAVSISVDVGVASNGVTIGAALSDTSAKATADVSGIDGGAGNDEISNTKAIDVSANTDVKAVGVAAKIGVANNGVAGGAALARATSTAQVFATGIDGGEDDDKIVNSGAITVGADPDSAKPMPKSAATSVAVTIAGAANGVGVGAALTDTSSTATADTKGIAGGAGRDNIYTEDGKVTVFSSSDADATSASVNVSVVENGVAAGAALARATAESQALATGLDGGLDADVIDNNSELEVKAKSDAGARTVGVSIAGAVNGGALGAALTDASALSVAVGSGIDGGAGNDEIGNTKSISVDASSAADTVAVSTAVTVAGTGVAAGAALSHASATSNAYATGIDGGEDADKIANGVPGPDDGTVNDNGEEIRVNANSDSNATSVSVSVSGALTGVAAGAALTDASATAMADARGIDGGDGEDRLDTALKITVDSKSHSTANGISVSGAGSAAGVAAGASLSNSSAISDSYATGVAGGLGNDWISNANEITASTWSTATAGSFSVTGSVSIGASVGAAMSDSSATAKAYSTGIGGGFDNDWIENIGKINVDSIAQATAASTSIAATASLGLAAGASVSNSSAIGEAHATGIDGGQGNDTITNSNEIAATSEVDAAAGSTSIGAGVGIAAAGLGKADSSATARAYSTGIDGGEGNNTITNTGKITVGSDPSKMVPMANAQANSTTVIVSASLAASVGIAASDSSAHTDATAIGIKTGLDTDSIYNSAAIDALSSSEAHANSSSLSVPLALVGVAAGQAASDSSSRATATTIGIASGQDDDSSNTAGNDSIINTGVINAESSSKGFANSSSLTVAATLIGATAGEAMSDSSAGANSTSTGIAGGAGADAIQSQSEMIRVKAVAESTATADAKSVSIVPIGVGIQSADSNSSATADAVARGIDGGKGGNEIYLSGMLDDLGQPVGEGKLDVTAESRVTGKSRSSSISGPQLVGVTLQEAKSESATVANSQAIGIDGGTGDDNIISDVLIDVDTLSESVTTSKATANSGFKLIGGSFGKSAADASSIVAAASIGIEGGDGSDKITGYKAILVTSKSNADLNATATVKSEAFIGAAAGKAASDASAVLAASATGIDGGANNDEITMHDSLTVSATSGGTVVSTSNANADASFIGDATAKTASSAAAATMAEAAGITGGDGDDMIKSLKSIVAMSEATLAVTQKSISVAEAGWFGDAFASATSDSSSRSEASTTGIDGGEGRDVITNNGMIDARATSNITVNQTTAAIASAGPFGNASSVAKSAAAAVGEAAATGISGGSGGDRITSSGPVAVEAGSTVTVKALTVSSAGPASSDARTEATARATGLDSGAGDDSIVNAHTVFAKAAPRVISATRTFGSGGNVDGKVGVALDAVATGIASGAGDDVVDNQGDVLAFAGIAQTERSASEMVDNLPGSFIDTGLVGRNASELVGRWIRIPAGDLQDIFTRIEAFDIATGMLTLRDPVSGVLQAGDKYILYDFGDKTVDIDSVAVTVGGRTSVDASTRANVRAIGLEAGDGNDAIDNAQVVDVRASNLIKAVTVTVGRNIDVDLDAVTDVSAIGIAADNEDNGSAVTQGSAGGSATFIDADRVGEDPQAILGRRIRFETGDASGFFTIVESFDSDTGTFTLRDPLPQTGLSNGDVYVLGGGSDTVANAGSVAASADSRLDASGWSFSFGGRPNVRAEGQVNASSAGAVGGGYDDQLDNSGTLSARSTADLSSTARTRAIFSALGQKLVFDATSTSVGLDGGSGNDRIENADNASIHSDSVTTARVAGVTTTINFFGIGGQTTNQVDARAEATASGMELGTGDDVALNAGEISVVATATPPTGQAGNCAPYVCLAEADSNLSYDETAASADAIATAVARGIYGVAGSNQALNSGYIDTEARAVATSFAKANTIIPSQDQSTVTQLASSGVNTFVDDSARGLDEGQLVGGRLRFPDHPNIDFLDAQSMVTGLNTQDNKKFIDSSLIGLDDSEVLNKRLRFPTLSNSNFVSQVVAFDSSTGELTLADDIPADNGNLLVVSGDAYTLSVLSADVVAFDSASGQFTLKQPISSEVTQGDKYTLSIVSGQVSANSFSAEPRIGNDVPVGTRVTFAKLPGFVALVESFDPDTGVFVLDRDIPGTLLQDDVYALSIDNSDAKSTTDATAFASGIELGDADAVVQNNRNITVTASATAKTGIVVLGPTDSAQTKAIAQAWGVKTGNGNDVVVNAGSIDVSAEAVAVSTQMSNVDEAATATGIETGSGDDLVYNTNTGSISTSKSVNGGSPVVGVAISTGGGSDMVVLEDGSVAIGDIDLGSANDSLTIINSAKVSGLNNDMVSLDGGTDTDSLNFDGAGSYSGSIQNFEIATKQGIGIFTLGNLPTMQQLKINQGTLQTNSSYDFASDGNYEVWIYGRDDSGKLSVNGGTASLAGDLSVIKGHGAFINGTKYHVVEGNIVDGSFDNVTLPDPSPLLNFSYVQEPGAAQIEANVASFTTMATNPVGMAVASYLDTLLPSATGDLSDVIGQIQSLSAQDLQVAYASLSPATYSSFTQSTALVNSASNGSLQQRMYTMRLGAVTKDTGFAYLSGGKPVNLAYNGSMDHLFDANDDHQGMYGLWLNAFGQKGNQDSDETNAGYNYNLSGVTLGFDHSFTDYLLAGFSLGYASSNLHIDQNLGEGDIEADTLSVYGSYFTEKGYVEGTLSYGYNNYWNTRNILIAGFNRVASSSHDGNLLSAMLGGGYYFNVSDWTWETFASLQYINLDEDSFDETGAGSVSLHVDRRSTNSMFSDVGLRFRKALERSYGSLIPELSIAWNHDYNIDDHIVSASFVGSPNNAFSVQGQDIAPNGLRLGTGVSIVHKNGLTSSLFYSAELRSGYTAQALLGQIRYEF